MAQNSKVSMKTITLLMYCKSIPRLSCSLHQSLNVQQYLITNVWGHLATVPSDICCCMPLVACLPGFSHPKTAQLELAGHVLARCTTYGRENEACVIYVFFLQPQIRTKKETQQQKLTCLTNNYIFANKLVCLLHGRSLDFM